MNDGTPKQQILERIKNATNILVTVSHDPSVDELSAALALTLMLNKMDKHATAVFSGKVPPAITFLEPTKTFESTVDSLRDFIIALDKSKADRLRYKVEDDVVRIFITPYRTTITEKDLQFSQGDFNVELIVALGVERREDLDTAITAHGRILHDAVTVTLNTKEDKNSLGVVDWQEPDASSLCEMLLNMGEAMQAKLLDEQIATALLTGIVSATQRFKNIHTSPKVMTAAAQLMAAGANQQLIAAKLEEAQDIPKLEQPTAKDGTTKLDEGQSKKLQQEAAAEKAQEAKKADGEMDIVHEKPASQPSPKKEEAASLTPSTAEASKELDEAIASAAVPAKNAGISVGDLKKDLDKASKELDKAAGPSIADNPVAPKIQQQTWRDQDVTPPTMGGTLNATTEDAEEEKRQEKEADRNHTILTHDRPIGGKPENEPSPINSYAAGVPKSEPPTVDPFSTPPPVHEFAPPSAPETPEPVESPVSAPAETIADLEADVHAKKDEAGVGDARQAVEAALNAMPFDPAHQPVSSVGAQPLSLPHIEHNESPIAAPAEEVPIEATPPLPPPPPMPDFSTLPPLPPAPQAAPVPTYDTNVNDMPPSSIDSSPSPLPPLAPPSTPPPASPAPHDPAQFKIPGQ
jgi:hypothetical protein